MHTHTEMKTTYRTSLVMTRDLFTEDALVPHLTPFLRMTALKSVLSRKECMCSPLVRDKLFSYFVIYSHGLRIAHIKQHRNMYVQSLDHVMTFNGAK